MDATYNVVGSGKTIARASRSSTVFNRWWAAFLEWRARAKVRAALNNLSERELNDIGIGRGEVDHVALNRTVDPRGAIFPS